MKFPYANEAQDAKPTPCQAAAIKVPFKPFIL